MGSCAGRRTDRHDRLDLSENKPSSPEKLTKTANF
jgi:hypothetical protein